MPAANIVTREMIFTIVDVVTDSVFRRPAPIVQEIHHPTVESTKPTMNPESEPKPIDLAGSDNDSGDAIRAAVAQIKKETGERREYENLSR